MKKLIAAALFVIVITGGYFYYQSHKAEINGNVPEYELKDAPSAADTINGGRKAVDQSEDYRNKVQSLSQDQLEQ